MTREELEFSISRYADGTLPESERLALEAILDRDADARALLEQERAMTALLRSDPVPVVRWDRLAESIASAIDEQEQERVAQASWWMRLRAPMGLALAASVLLSAAIAVHFLLGPHAGPGTSRPLKNAPPASQILVLGPQPDRPAGPVVSEISIGAGGTYARESPLAPYADEIDTHPSRVVIASGISPQQAPPPGFPY